MKSKELIHVLSFDYDGCLGPRFKASSLQEHLQLLKKIKAVDCDKRIVLIGSARQSHEADHYCNKINNNGLAFKEIPKLCNFLDAKFDDFLLADVYGDLKTGTSYRRSMSGEIVRHGSWKHDNEKLTILYGQMHKIASKHPMQNILFEFYDDQINIIQPLYEFFRSNPDFIPSNISLKINNYNSITKMPLSYNKIHGTGNTDFNYYSTIRLFMHKYSFDQDCHPIFKNAKAQLSKFIIHLELTGVTNSRNHKLLDNAIST